MDCYTRRKRVMALFLAVISTFSFFSGCLLTNVYAADYTVKFRYGGNTYTAAPGTSGSGAGVSWSLDSNNNLTLTFTSTQAGGFEVLEGSLTGASVTVLGGGAGGSSGSGYRVSNLKASGSGGNGGGGGASVTQSVTIIEGTTYTVTVGGGGQGGQPQNSGTMLDGFSTSWSEGKGTAGGDSVFGSVVAAGGTVDGGGAGPKNIQNGYANGGNAGSARGGGGGAVASRYDEDDCGNFRTNNMYACWICGYCSSGDPTGITYRMNLYGVPTTGRSHASQITIGSHNGGTGLNGGANGGVPANEHCNPSRTGGGNASANTGGGGGGGAFGTRVYKSSSGNSTFYAPSYSGYVGGFATSGGNGGSGLVTLTAKVESKGSVQLTKSSANTGISDGNPCYSLKGAVYGVFASEANAKSLSNPVATMTTDAGGVTQTIEINQGTYYVREMTAPPGYALDPQTYPVKVVPKELSKVTVKDEPILDPINVLVKKIDSATGTGVSSGIASLEGAEFTFCFYPGQYATVAEAEASGAALRSWVFRTDKDGFAAFDGSYLVSGDSFWTDPNGNPTMPLGTVVAQETKAPAHYQIDTTKVVAHITEDGSDKNLVYSYNAPEHPNVLVHGGVSVDKHDSVLASGAQGDGSLAGAEFSIINENDTAVTVNGKSYAKGVTVAVIVTNSSGHAESAADLLPLGSYSVKETKAPAGYELNTKWSANFTITDAEKGKIVNVGTMTDEVTRGKLTIQKADAETGLHTPQGDGKLAGAVFNVVNASAKTIVFNGKEYAPGTVVTTATTDGAGTAVVSGLPYGKYTVSEVSIPSDTGYTVNTDFGPTVTVNGSGNYSGEDCPETITVHGGVELHKVDESTGLAPQGDATLEGAVFSIINSSPQSVYVNGKVCAVGAEVATVTTDANGEANLAPVLPMGTYTVKEKTASAGYQLNTNWSKTITIREDGQTVKIEGDDACKETPIMGGLRIQKVDEVSGQAVPEGNAKLSGAVFEVKNASARAVVYNGKTYAPGEAVATIKTDSNGVAAIASGLPMGTYTVKEVSASEGYLLNTDWNGTVRIREQGKVEALEGENACRETPAIGGLSLIKTDALLKKAAAEGNATLSGAVYQIINASANSVIFNGSPIAPGSVVTTITTDPSGAALLNTGLPYGEYKVKEQSPSKGYLLNESWEGTAVITKNGEIAQLTGDKSAPEYPIAGGVSVQKIDKDTGNTIGPGGIEMVNAEFAVINRSDAAVVVNGVTVQPFIGDFDRDSKSDEGVALRIYTDKNGFATSGATDLPYGKYEIYEVHQPSGYLRNNEWVQSFTVSENGVIFAFDGANACVEELARVDVHFRKVNAITGDPIPGVVFRVTHVETGESHIIVTDPNGVYDSSYIPNTQNTNANDLGADANGNLDESKIDYRNGVWFGGGTPMDTAPDGSRMGAYVYGNYVFEELRCEANKGLLLVEPTFFVYAKNAVMNFGDFLDHTPEAIETTLLDADSESHYIAPGSVVNLYDTVVIHNCLVGREYTIEATLMEKDTGKPLCNEKGDPVTATAKFTAIGSEMTLSDKIKFSFDAALLTGSPLVAYEKLTDGAELVYATHEDIDDESQTVYYPSIKTVAAGENGSKYISAGESTVIVDTVYYENFAPGKSVEMQASLMDKATGKPVLDANGNPVKASKTFKPDSSGGQIEVRFEFDSTGLEGKTLVAFERAVFVSSGYLLAAHEDLKDDSQTVTIVRLGTVATGEKDGIVKSIAGAPGTVFYDRVDYEGLFEGKTYTVSGVIYDAEANAPLEVGGKEITAEATFTAETGGKGSVWLEFVVDSTGLEGKTLVAFEYLHDGKDNTAPVIATVEDIEDLNETVYIPEILTTATTEDGFHMSGADKITINDEVFYSNLVPGQEYRVEGTLISKTTLAPLKDASGAPVAASKTFMPDKAGGSIILSFELDASDLAGETVVAYETLNYKAPDAAFKFLTEHKDPNDEEQSVHVVELRTIAKSDDGEKFLTAGESTKVIDTISYSNFIPGKEYEIRANLADKTTGELIKDTNGKIVEARKIFAPDKPDGTVEMEIVFDASDYDSVTLVVFEYLYDAPDSEASGTQAEKPIASHADINDEAQTVCIPQIKTTATTDRGSHTAPSAEEIVINDEVFYADLMPGREYKLEGKLVDKENGDPILNAAGESVTASVEFTPDKPNGSIILSFKLDTVELAGKSVVAFETLKYRTVSEEYVFVTEHADIDDEDQTVRVPKILTTAATVDNIQTVMPEGDIEIRDTVHVSNAVVGTEYIFRGMLMDENGVAIELQPVELRKVAAKTDFDVILKFTVNAESFALAGKHITVFERMYEMQLAKEGEGTGTPGEKVEIEVARHTEPQDEDQTVWLPEIRTTATGADDEKIIEITRLTDEVKILDTVQYCGLKPGQEYTVTGTLMDKATGEALADNSGNAITATRTFVPDETNGSVVLEFTFPGEYAAGKSVVAFERVTQEGVVVAVHEDLNDADQTVEVSSVGLIYKYNATTEKGLPNAVITVTDTTTGESIDITTDAEGFAYFSTFPGHSYSYREKTAPDGFQLNPDENRFTVSADGKMSEEAKILNMWVGTVVLSKVDAVTNAPVPGAELAVYRKNGNDFIEMFRQVTDEHGRIYYYPAGMTGTYYFKELSAPDGYYLDDEMHAFTIHADMTVTGQTVFTNAPSGCVVLKKVSEHGDRLQGAKYAVYSTDGTLITTQVTDEFGRIYFISPGPGSYYFIELEAPKGYIRTDEKAEFAIDQHGVVYGVTKLVNRSDGSPSTGDHLNANLWLGGMVVSTIISSAGTVVLFRRKKREMPSDSDMS